MTNVVMHLVGTVCEMSKQLESLFLPTIQLKAEVEEWQDGPGFFIPAVLIRRPHRRWHRGRDEDPMNRRDFVRLGWATVIGAGAGKLRPAFAQSLALRQVPGAQPHPMAATSEPKATGRAADFTLQIAPAMVELAPQVVISTIGYNNKVPGPLMRMREGQPVAVEVVNDTDVPEYVHWHGLLVPSDVGGAEEEGTPPVPPHGRRRYQFVAKPAGSQWYHSHTEAMLDLHRGALPLKLQRKLIKAKGIIF
jgi:Multicopper oxidase